MTATMVNNKGSSVEDWNNRDVVAWLKNAGLNEYLGPFSRYGVNGPLLLTLDKEALNRLGNYSEKSRRQFIRALTKLRQTEKQAAAAAAAAATAATAAAKAAAHCGPGGDKKEAGKKKNWFRRGLKSRADTALRVRNCLTLPTDLLQAVSSAEPGVDLGHVGKKGITTAKKVGNGNDMRNKLEGGGRVADKEDAKSTTKYTARAAARAAVEETAATTAATVTGGVMSPSRYSVSLSVGEESEYWSEEVWTESEDEMDGSYESESGSESEENGGDGGDGGDGGAADAIDASFESYGWTPETAKAAGAALEAAYLAISDEAEALTQRIAATTTPLRTKTTGGGSGGRNIDTMGPDTQYDQEAEVLYENTRIDFMRPEDADEARALQRALDGEFDLDAPLSSSKAFASEPTAVAAWAPPSQQQQHPESLYVNMPEIMAAEVHRFGYQTEPLSMTDAPVENIYGTPEGLARNHRRSAAALAVADDPISPHASNARRASAVALAATLAPVLTESPPPPPPPPPRSKRSSGGDVRRRRTSAEAIVTALNHSMASIQGSESLELASQRQSQSNNSSFERRRNVLVQQQHQRHQQQRSHLFQKSIPKPDYGIRPEKSSSATTDATSTNVRSRLKTSKPPGMWPTPPPNVHHRDNNKAQWPAVAAGPKEAPPVSSLLAVPGSLAASSMPVRPPSGARDWRKSAAVAEAAAAGSAVWRSGPGVYSTKTKQASAADRDFIVQAQQLAQSRHRVGGSGGSSNGVVAVPLSHIHNNKVTSKSNEVIRTKRRSGGNGSKFASSGKTGGGTLAANTATTATASSARANSDGLHKTRAYAARQRSSEHKLAVAAAAAQETSASAMVRLQSQPYFVGAIDRRVAEAMLAQRGIVGSCLVRESVSSPGQLTLSVWIGKSRHIRIRTLHDGRVCLRSDPSEREIFSSITGMVRFYTLQKMQLEGTPPFNLSY